MRKYSAILLYDTKKRILLQLRDENAPTWPSKWSFFGGGINDGETPKQAAIREAKEELNHDLRTPRLLAEVGGRSEGVDVYVYVFVEECGDKSQLRLNEGKDWGWFTIDEAVKLTLPPLSIAALKSLKGKF